MRRARSSRTSVAGYLAAVFLAVLGAVSILPACGDDRDPAKPGGDVDLDTDMGTDVGTDDAVVM